MPKRRKLRRKPKKPRKKMENLRKISFRCSEDLRSLKSMRWTFSMGNSTLLPLSRFLDLT